MLTTQIGMSLLNIPYVWGGKNPLAGFDCSGLVQWVMTSVGFEIVGPRNAQGLYMLFVKTAEKIDSPKEGALAFFGADVAGIEHIGLVIDGHRMIEAFNGGEFVTTKNIAQCRGAVTRISPISVRKDLAAILMPDYSTVGL